MQFFIFLKMNFKAFEKELQYKGRIA